MRAHGQPTCAAGMLRSCWLRAAYAAERASSRAACRRRAAAQPPPPPARALRRRMSLYSLIALSSCVCEGGDKPIKHKTRPEACVHAGVEGA